MNTEPMKILTDEELCQRIVELPENEKERMYGIVLGMSMQTLNHPEKQEKNSDRPKAS